ncbi:MAG: AAA family ATPase [Filomicrobium sp.]
MIFGLGRKKDKSSNETSGGETKSTANTKSTSLNGKSAPAEGNGGDERKLSASQLRRKADLSHIAFKTTSDLDPSLEPIGQERALRALEFGASMPAAGYNVFALSSDPSGTAIAVRQQLEKLAQKAPAPDDWVYVQNFKDANAPKSMRLPAGRALAFAEAMAEVVDELSSTIPAAFNSEDYQARARALESEHSGAHDAQLQALSHKAAERGIALLRTPMGFTFAPMLEGKVVKPEAFEAMPPGMQADVRSNIETLQLELEALLLEAPRLEKAKRRQLRQFNKEVALHAIDAALVDIVSQFGDVDAVSSYLSEVREDLADHASLFLTDNAAGAETRAGDQFADLTRAASLRRYMVNVVVAQKTTKGAPVVEAINPNYGSLMGRSEHLPQLGAFVTDFMLIKPGTIHKANGGYLVVDARKLLSQPFAWEALKRSLQSGELHLEHPTENAGAVQIQSIDPEPIPLEVKVVLIGDRGIYTQLSQSDPEFQQLFKVQADFSNAVPRDEEMVRAFAELIAGLAQKNALAPFERDAVAALVEHASRLANDQHKLVVAASQIEDLTSEAGYWALQDDRETTTRADVRKAIAEKIERIDRVRDLDQESFERGLIEVETEGEKVGQVNGLSVLQLGELSFGRPNRITARTRFGAGRIVDIEREAKLSGPLHAKGVMILWSYLAGTFAKDKPLALSASLVFEQSYGGIDGDSASSAELYALISALSGVQIRQGIAITGSVDQFGEVQAVGGINEKIEGFFDVCNSRGLNGDQGVIIPKANVQHLMLREDIVEAVEEGRFSVFAVDTIEDGVELLTGVAAGSRGTDGTFPKGTVFAKAAETLATYSHRANNPELRGEAKAANGKGAAV